MSEEMTDKERAEAVLKKYDKDSDTMEYKGIMAKIVSAIAITFSIFQLYTATFGVLDAQLQRAVHLGFGLALVYLLYPTRKSWSRTKLHPFDLLLAILGAAAPAYILIEYNQLVMRSGLVTTPDLVVGILGILPNIAARFAVDIPTAGLLVSGFAQYGPVPIYKYCPFHIILNSSIYINSFIAASSLSFSSLSPMVIRRQFLQPGTLVLFLTIIFLSNK